MAKFNGWDSYFLPEPQAPEETRVFRNLIGATTAAELHGQELRISLARVFDLEEAPLAGLFDFAHHQAIHRYVFGTVYEWAGEPRTVDMGKSHRLWPANAILEQAPRTYGAIAADHYLHGLDPGEFVEHLAEHWDEINAGARHIST